MGDYRGNQYYTENGSPQPGGPHRGGRRIYIYIYIYHKLSCALQSYGFEEFKKVKRRENAKKKQQNSLRGVPTLRQNPLQHLVFEGVAAKNRGRVASNEPRGPLFGPRAPPTDPQAPHPNGSEGSDGLKAGFREPS